jgi:hypothetical protein
VYQLNGTPLEELHAWLEPYRRIWDTHLDKLEQHLDRSPDRATNDYETPSGNEEG